MNDEIVKFREDTIRYFSTTVSWINSASRLVDVVIKKNKFKIPLINGLRRDIRYKIAEFNNKSDFIYDAIIQGKIPMDALEGEFNEKSELLQRELRDLKEKLDSIIIL